MEGTEDISILSKLKVINNSKETININTKTKTRLIHSRKMAIFLQCKGFVLIGVEQNLKNSNKVYLFADSGVIQDAMNQYNDHKEFHQFVTVLSERS